MSDTPRTDEVWSAAVAWLTERDEREDPQHAALANLAQDLERELAAANKELEEWKMRALTKLVTQTLSCMWCGEIVAAPEGFVPGTPLNDDHRAAAFQQHAAACAKHPMRQLERELAEARAKFMHAMQRLQVEVITKFGLGAEAGFPVVDVVVGMVNKMSEELAATQALLDSVITNWGEQAGWTEDEECPVAFHNLLVDITSRI